LFLSATTS
ncbi:hypothetical protein D046_7856B, partial [Vibrio parahaemolyticus V-223/04]